MFGLAPFRAAINLVAQTDGGGSVFEQGASRNYVVDIAIVVVLVGLALFAVCRSSRRT